jgi:peptidoglycan/LPS O-acetylase OafA/YrhL
MPVVLWVLPVLDGWGWFASAGPTTAFLLRYAAYLAIAIVGGMAAAQLVERPMLTLRDRRFPSRAHRRKPPP